MPNNLARKVILRPYLERRDRAHNLTCRIVVDLAPLNAAQHIHDLLDRDTLIAGAVQLGHVIRDRNVEIRYRTFTMGNAQHQRCHGLADGPKNRDILLATPLTVDLMHKLPFVQHGKTAHTHGFQMVGSVQHP